MALEDLKTYERSIENKAQDRGVKSETATIGAEK